MRRLNPCSLLGLPTVVALFSAAGCFDRAGAFLIFENRTGKELHLSTNVSPYREIVVRSRGSVTLRLPLKNAGPSNYLVKDQGGELLGTMTARYISRFYDTKSDNYRVPIRWE